jgi:hypothetical protein
MSFSIFGLAVSQGIAIGRAQVIANAAMEIEDLREALSEEQKAPKKRAAKKKAAKKK